MSQKLSSHNSTGPQAPVCEEPPTAPVWSVCCGGSMGLGSGRSSQTPRSSGTPEYVPFVSPAL